MRPVLQDLGHDSFSELLEHLRIPEKAGHVDQEVPVERLDFGSVLAQELDVIRKRRLGVERHAARDSPADRGIPVVAEVEAGGVPHRGENVPELLLGVRFLLGHRIGRQIGVPADLRQALRDRIGGKDEISAAAIQSAARHPRVACRGFILHERDSANILDLAES